MIVPKNLQILKFGYRDFATCLCRFYNLPMQISWFSHEDIGICLCRFCNLSIVYYGFLWEFCDLSLKILWFVYGCHTKLNCCNLFRQKKKIAELIMSLVCLACGVCKFTDLSMQILWLDYGDFAICLCRFRNLHMQILRFAYSILWFTK